MGKTEDYILLEYKQCGVLDKAGRVSLVFSRTEKKPYVKKIVDKSVGELYLRLKRMDEEAFPKIRAIVDMGECYTVIEEYIAGKTIRQRIEQSGVMDEAEAKRCIREVLKAVSILHKNGIVHRDITENNIMLTEGGRIKIIDFNISHNADKSKAKDTMVMGTSGYAAPEQFGFFRSDERTDIYSIGVLYNYMLTGSTELGGYKGTAERIIKKCTEFSPENRYKSCVEVLTEFKVQNAKKGLKPLSKGLIAAMIVQAVLIMGSIIDLLNGGGWQASIALIVEGTTLLVLPFVIIGNYFNWQERVSMDKLPPQTRKIISIIIYVFILVLVAEILGSSK
jgi:serine/threonine protein kinase